MELSSFVLSLCMLLHLVASRSTGLDAKLFFEQLSVDNGHFIVLNGFYA